MANTTTTPNMNLILPTPGQEPGPLYAADLNAAFTTVDLHTHVAGQGVQIPTAGLLINADLPLNNAYNLVQARSLRMTSQSAALALVADINSVYVVNGDLWYNDVNGVQIQITVAGAVNTASSGNISGMGATTASVVYTTVNSRFSFYSNTNTPAPIYVGPIRLGVNTASPKTITIAPNAAQAADYNLTFPAAAPAAGQILNSDASGNLTWQTDAIGRLPLGSVIATFPNLSGAYSCSTTTSADAAGFVKCNGGTISDGTSPMNGAVVPNINNEVFLRGSTTAGSTGGTNANITLITANLPSHTHAAGTFATTLGITSTAASLTGTTSFASTAHTHGSTAHTHGMTHNHQVGYQNTDTRNYVNLNNSGTNTTWTTGASLWFYASTLKANGSDNAPLFSQSFDSVGRAIYSSGVLNDPGSGGTSAAVTASTTPGVTGSPSATASVGVAGGTASLTGSNTVGGTSAAAGSGTSFSVTPLYMTGVYLMRIK